MLRVLTVPGGPAADGWGRAHTNPAGGAAARAGGVTGQRSARGGRTPTAKCKRRRYRIRVPFPPRPLRHRTRRRTKSVQVCQQAHSPHVHGDSSTRPHRRAGRGAQASHPSGIRHAGAASVQAGPSQTPTVVPKVTTNQPLSTRRVKSVPLNILTVSQKGKERRELKWYFFQINKIQRQAVMQELRNNQKHLRLKASGKSKSVRKEGFMPQIKYI